LSGELSRLGWAGKPSSGLSVRRLVAFEADRAEKPVSCSNINSEKQSSRMRPIAHARNRRRAGRFGEIGAMIGLAAAFAGVIAGSVSYIAAGVVASPTRASALPANHHLTAAR